MRRSVFILLILSVCARVAAQPLTDKPVTPNEIIAAVKKAQQSIRTVEYTLQRTDTLLSADTRTMMGRVLMQVVPQDTIYGFHFFSEQDGDNSEQVYDGHVAYITDQDKKQYQMSTTPGAFSNLLSGGGGRLIMRDLVKLDTANAVNIRLRHDEKYYYLTIGYPDLKQYDIIKRWKTITIDKLNMLPLAVRQHQENYGKVQDLYYHITELKVNQPLNYDFSSPPFLREYSQFIPVKTTHPMLSLKGKHAPAFMLSSFDGESISSGEFKGKAVLLDLWEVWCGPCIISMPKIEKIYEKHKSKGFQVYGIVNDLKQLESAKNLVKSKKILFPMLTGSAKFKEDYKFDGGVPMYVLIDKNGKISWISWGDAPDMEEEIIRALQ